MEKRKEDVAAKKKLVMELIGLVEKMRSDLGSNNTERGFTEFALKYDENLVDVSADKNTAHPGSWQFEVKQLAQKSSAMTSGFSDPDKSYVGVGYISFDTPDGGVKEVYIDEDNADLNSIAKLINRDDSNGMHANVINDGSGSDTPWRLIISMDDVGDDNLANFPYFYFVDGEDDFYVEFEREAQDAKVMLDGFEIELPDNKTSDLIPGLTIDLKKAVPGEEFTIKVSEDTEKIKEKARAIIDSINEVLKFINEQNTMDENTNTKRTLGGDITLQTLESKIRRLMFTAFQTRNGVGRMGDLGVAFEKTGLLSFDENKFASMVKKDFKHVVNIMVGYWNEEGERSTGFVGELQKTVGHILRFPNGILQTRKKGLDSKTEQIDRRIADRQRIIERKEKMLKDKFARLEATVNRIKSQGAGLAGLAGGAVDPVTQLG